uniref:Uncharacterized protein n=1 Tax=Arundo donax TaxID=35708 RepID=A0A0A9HCG5_ARUDO
MRLEQVLLNNVKKSLKDREMDHKAAFFLFIQDG